jgi:hypothetical protein
MAPAAQQHTLVTASNDEQGLAVLCCRWVAAFLQMRTSSKMARRALQGALTRASTTTAEGVLQHRTQASHQTLA